MFFPDVSGLELARRATNRNIPILLCSGHPDLIAKLRRFNYPYLSKPFDLDNLVTEAKRILADTDRNIRQVRASLLRVQETAAQLNAEIAKARRLVAESRRMNAPRPSR